MKNYTFSAVVALVMALLTNVLFANAAVGATFFVSPRGSNTTGNGSTERPWATIGHGVSKLAGGDSLVVRDGEYVGIDNFINGRIIKIASGSPTAFTTIRAENPMKVRIRNGKTLNYYDSMVYLTAQIQYVHVDGFIFDISETRDPEFIAIVEGNHNQLTRSIFRRQGATNDYAGWVGIFGNFNLVEDCAGVGSARYGFITGGPESKARNNIFRRCVARMDYTASPQPKAAFSVYGNNDGHNVRDVLFQNCIAVDGKRGPSASEDTYGGFYFPKNAANVTIQGSIVLNNEAGHAGYFVKELQAQNIKVEHSIAWDVYGSEYTVGIRVNGKSPEPVSFSHMTIGKAGHAYYNRDSGRERVLKNSVFLDVTKMALGKDAGWTTETNNAFGTASLSQGKNSQTANVVLRYLPRVEPSSGLAKRAENGMDIGANVMKRYGVSGARWGEKGFDQLTEEPLWPWPYENEIKAVFAEPNPPHPGAVPSTNDTARGFAAKLDAYGQPMTLTRYVWQYLGNPIPPEIYGSRNSPAANAAPAR
jgi:hypothetical protein